MLSKSQIEQYYDEGYTIATLLDLKKLEIFKRELALSISKAMSGLTAKLEFDQKALEDENRREDYLVNDAMIMIEKLEHRNLSEIYNIIGFSSILQRILMDDPIISAVNQILDRPETSNLFVNSINCRMDPPGINPYLYGWHKDRNSNIPDSRFVQLWAPVVSDLPAEQGGLVIAPGSHRHLDVKTDSSEQEQESLAKAAPIRPPFSAAPIDFELKATTVELQLGQCIFFQPDLYHKSGLNVTENRMRYCVSGMYHDPLHPSFRYMNLNVK